MGGGGDVNSCRIGKGNNCSWGGVVKRLQEWGKVGEEKTVVHTGIPETFSGRRGLAAPWVIISAIPWDDYFCMWGRKVVFGLLLTTTKYVWSQTTPPPASACFLLPSILQPLQGKTRTGSRWAGLLRRSPASLGSLASWRSWRHSDICTQQMVSCGPKALELCSKPRLN